jgi:type II secretory pathway component PulC
VDTGEAKALVDRNVFCSDCPAVGAGDPSPTVAIPARSSLELVATSLGDRPSDSFATLIDVTSGTQGAYWVGQRVSGIGTLEKVAGTYVLVRNDAGAVERVTFDSGSTAPKEKPAAIAKAEPATAAAAPAWAARVNKIDDTTYEVDRELIRELMTAGAKLPGVRVMPAVGKDGKLNGVRVAQARKDSLAAGLGLKNGDVIQAVDGTALDDTDAVLEMYGRLDSASMARVSILRGGKTTELEYRLR